MTAACPFCAIVDGKAPATIVKEWERAIAIVPLNPVTDGHVLVLPKEHVESATVSPMTTGMTMVAASELADAPCNIITSVGAEATQTVRHLHVHIVPRRAGDGLALPWATAS